MKMFNFLLALVVVGVAMLSAAVPVRAESLIFVSDRIEPGNWDLYIMDDVDSPSVVRRLTTDAGIDNHADLSPDGTKVVWSSTSDYTGANGDGDFEIYVADLADDPATGDLEIVTASIMMLTDNDYPDRHPHFSHDPDNLRIVYSCKYVCVEVIKKKKVSCCSMVCWQDVVDPCGDKCEGMRVMDADDLDGDNMGDNRVDIDHAYLTRLNRSVWPPRPARHRRWVGHPSFSHDDSKLLFSGAVDGDGNYWEVYVMDWDTGENEGLSLRQVTDEALYPPNGNPIQMNAGAHFSEDDSSILLTSTRTASGISHLFEVPADAEMVPVSPGNRHAFHDLVSETFNVYVPEQLEDGRILLTSDIDEFTGMKSCQPLCEPEDVYTFRVKPFLPHVIRLEGTGMASPDNVGGLTRIHLDAYELDGVLKQEGDSTAYAGSWTSLTSPNASGGYYMRSDGSSSGDYVTIAVPSGTSDVALHLGKTPFSGVVRVLVDGIPITEGDVAIVGDDPNSGFDLYTPDYTTGNDLDMITIEPDGSSVDNLTDNNLADEVLLLGDEVSWFCGLKPNLSLCTYLPKYLTVQQLGFMLDSEDGLPDNFPKKDLYPIAMDALQQFMYSGGNGLRQHYQGYWEWIMYELERDPNSKQLIVLPTPVGFCLDNHPPTCSPGITYQQAGSDIVILALPEPSTDLEGDPIHYDTVLSYDGGAFINVGSNRSEHQVTLQNLPDGQYRWRTAAKDTRGGLCWGPTQTFCVPPLFSDINGNFKVDLSDLARIAAQWSQSPCGIDNLYCDLADLDMSTVVDPGDLMIIASEWIHECASEPAGPWLDGWSCSTQCYGDADCAKQGLFRVSSNDLVILLAAMGTSYGDPDYESRGDFNRDLEVNFADMEILQTWYNKMGVPTDCQTSP